MIKTTPKEFKNEYNDEIIELLKVPLVAFTKWEHNLIPYEYNIKPDALLRYHRVEDELNQILFTKCKKLMLFCIKEKIQKEYVQRFIGGNLVSYINMKKNYGKI